MRPEELTPPLELARGGRPGASLDEALELLRAGKLSVEGRVVDASNATFYCRVASGSASRGLRLQAGRRRTSAVGLPGRHPRRARGGRLRGVGATGWSIVPPTVFRDGPAGPGMVQLWIDCADDIDIARFMRRRDLEQLRNIAVFDAVINNADRKGGHLLPTRDGHVYGVDHGVTFSVEDKLRTVLWQWAGARLPHHAREVLAKLADALEGSLGERLGELLTRHEVWRTRSRVQALLATGRHPEPGDGWPPVPWPPI